MIRCDWFCRVFVASKPTGDAVAHTPTTRLRVRRYHEGCDTRHRVSPEDFVATVGFASTDYVIVD